MAKSIFIFLFWTYYTRIECEKVSYKKVSQNLHSGDIT